MRIVLPTIKPIIDCYPDLANMLSILNCEDLANNWISSNFIQLVYRRNEQTSYGSFLDFMRMGNDISVYEHCPYLYVNHIDKSFVNELFGDVFGFLSYCLRRRIYIQMYTNKRYLPQKNAIEYDFMHETFIFGINTDEKIVNLADFYDGKYVQIECSYQDFEKAYLNSFSDNPYYQSDIFLGTNLAKYNMNKIILLQYTRHDLYRVDKKIIQMKVKDYIEGKDSFNRITDSYIASGYDFFYGIDFYEQLIIDLKRQWFDIRKVHVLLSHKLLLKNQIGTMKDNGFINLCNYNALMSQVDFLIDANYKAQNKYLLLNCRAKKKCKDITDLIDMFDYIKENDLEFMNLLFKSLQ